MFSHIVLHNLEPLLIVEFWQLAPYIEGVLLNRGGFGEEMYLYLC